MNTEQRLDILTRSLGELDAFLLVSPVNIMYYTGLAPTSAMLLVTRRARYFLTDSRYFEMVQRRVPGVEAVLKENAYPPLIAQLCREQGVKTIGFEKSVMTVDRFEGLTGAVDAAFVGTQARIERPRMIKDAEELACLSQAQRITDDAFLHILDFLRPGRTEREVARELELFMLRAGAGKAFPVIAVAGENSSLPHGVPTDRELRDGDFLTMDFGASVEGYCADMTRTVAIGHADELMRTVYETVLQAQELAFREIRPGAVCSHVDAAARRHIDNAGFAGCFGHGLGHSFGLEIHEEPRFSPSCDTALEQDMVITVEPGIYLPGRFGVRIEDTVRIVPDGYRRFTESEKKLLVL